MIAALLASVVPSGASIPATVQHAGPQLVRVAHVKDFPPGAVPWPIADPNTRFNNSDIHDPRFPNRGLILAGCSADLCVLHFQIGGIVSPFCLLALEHTQQKWEPVWYARIPRALTSFEELESVVERASSIELTEESWCNEVP